MAYTLGNKCAKNLCKGQFYFNLSSKMWSLCGHMFFWEHSVGRAEHHITPFLSNAILEIIAHIWRPTVVIDFVHCICCIFEIQIMKSFTAPEMTFKGHIHGHSQCHRSLYRLEFLPETGKKVGYTYFQTRSMKWPWR